MLTRCSELVSGQVDYLILLEPLSERSGESDVARVVPLVDDFGKSIEEGFPRPLWGSAFGVC